MVELWLPKRRSLPFREIPAKYPGGVPTIVMDCGTLDGHQFEEIEAKVKEDEEERMKKSGGRFRAPIRLTITRFIDKATRKLSGYILEYKREE